MNDKKNFVHEQSGTYTDLASVVVRACNQMASHLVAEAFAGDLKNLPSIARKSVCMSNLTELTSCWQLTGSKSSTHKPLPTKMRRANATAPMEALRQLYLTSRF